MEVEVAVISTKMEDQMAINLVCQLLGRVVVAMDLHSELGIIINL
jgi:hypothetical protein